MEMVGRTYSAVSSYRYGFNGQEKTPEIAPNTTTALFWEYDARISRRWNLDPKPNVMESPYAVIGNNPIRYNDPDGDTLKVKGSFFFKLSVKLNLTIASIFSKATRKSIRTLKESKFTHTIRRSFNKEIKTIANSDVDATQNGLKYKIRNDDEMDYFNPNKGWDSYVGTGKGSGSTIYWSRKDRTTGKDIKGEQRHCL